MNQLRLYLVVSLVTMGCFNHFNEKWSSHEHKLRPWEIVFLGLFWPIGWIILIVILLTK